jgi:hypothetical protein
MRVKHLAQKNKMGKGKMANATTSWVPSVFTQMDLDKAQADGLIFDDDQVIVPSTEQIPKPKSGFRVMFFAFLLRGLSLPAHEFLRGLLFMYSVQLHQLTPNSILHIACFITLCESFLGIEPYFLSRDPSFGSAPVSHYRRNLNWAELLFLSALNLSTWSFLWLPQYKVGGPNGFISKTERSLPPTSMALPLLMPPKN